MLNTARINAFKPEAKPKKYRDGRGLYVIVRPDGAKWWRFDYRFAGVRKTISLGTYPDVGLKAARTAHEEARAHLRAGRDPSEVRQAIKRERRVRAGTTFEAAARSWLASRKGSVELKTYIDRKRLLDRVLIPALGDRPIAAIETVELLPPIRAIADQGHFSLARRARQVCAQIFRAAVQDGIATKNPALDLKGALGTYTETSHPALTDPEQIGGLLRAIDGYDGSPVVRAALQLAPLVFVRPGELRQAEWSEIDLEAAIWRLPAAKMKMRSDHLVPLSTQAVAILTKLIPLTSESKYVFPSNRTRSRPMSSNTLNAALRRLGYTSEQMTAHGFRAMARTVIHEVLRVPGEVIELQLAHATPGALGAVYNRARFLDQRIEMMTRWADLLGSGLL